MMLPASVLFSILFFSCSLLQNSSASFPPSTKRNGFYTSIIATICHDSESDTVDKACKSCLEPLISYRTLTIAEISSSQIEALKSCVTHLPEEFKEFRCELETNSSYLRNLVDKTCFDKLQTSNPFIDFEKADFSKMKSNPGYYGLSELTSLTLAGIIKHLKSKKKPPASGSGTQDFCTLFQESGFITALSQANGKSWESNFEKKPHLFFDVINKLACKDSPKCYPCLKTFLNSEIVSSKEISIKTFNELLKCKETLSNEFKIFKRSSKELVFGKRVPKSCIDDLKLKEKTFQYGKDVNITDLAENTYFLQEVLKMGVATMFFYFHKHKDQLADDMTAGLCETVVHRYIRSLLYAMPSLEADEELFQVKSEYPYKKLIQKPCEGSKRCEACYRKITSLIDIRKAKEVSVDGMAVLKHCSEYQTKEFKSFSSEIEETSFQACMKHEASYKALVKGYPMDQEVDIKTSPSLPRFPHFKKYLQFLFNGVCYYYNDESVTNPALAKEMHDMDLPGAFMFVIPATNEYDTRGCHQETQ